MCGLCGMLGGALPSAVETFAPSAANDDAGARRRLRLRQLRLLNEVLRAHRVTVDDAGGALFLLRGVTGRTAIVPSLTALWPAVERLSGRPCDPLDSSPWATVDDLAVV